MSTLQNYFFITRWQIKSPLPAVWAIISNPLAWPEWWHGVKSVRIVSAGDEHGLGQVMQYTFKSFLPYALTLDLELTERQELSYLKGKASGALEGWGEWKFTETGEITEVICTWQVVTTSSWMNALAFALRPLFIYNHTLIMKQGERCLQKKLVSTHFTS